MFFVVYDWQENIFRFRAGKVFTSFRGVETCRTLEQWRAHLEQYGLRTGRKTDASTWRVERL